MERVTKLKTATALVRTRAGSGSAYLAGRTGDALLLVTNDHVIRQGGSAQKDIEVILASGSEGAQPRPARVVEDSPENDLAVLLVDGKGVDAAPLFPRVDPIRETEQVVTIGYPFGSLLAAPGTLPAPTIGRASISSLRKNKDGDLVVAQLDGEINPGNSGGPVVDLAGALVGVAQAKVIGTAIAFMIPAESTSEWVTRASMHAATELDLLRKNAAPKALPDLVEAKQPAPVETMPADPLIAIPVTTKSVPLSNRIETISEAGGGRYLLVKVVDRSDLQIVDLQATRVAGSLPVGDIRAVMGSGDMRALVYVPREDKIHLYSLSTLERLKTIPNPYSDPVAAIAMGRSRGDLAVIATRRTPAYGSPVLDFRLFDVDQMRPLRGPEKKQAEIMAQAPLMLVGNAVLSRVMLYAGHMSFYAPLLPREGVMPVFVRQSAAFGDDGRLFGEYGSGVDAFGNRFLPVGAEEPGQWVPGADSTLALLMRPGTRAGGADRRPRIYAPGKPEPVACLALVLPQATDPHRSVTAVPPERRVSFRPSEGIVTQVADSDDAILVHRFEADILAQAAAADAPVILSAMTLAATPGAHLTYTVSAQTRSPPITFSLQMPPPGMKISTYGVITWDVPVPPPPSGRFVVRVMDHAAQVAEKSVDYLLP
ncbi:MAG TPA: serine protease [Myxococcales bacterium]